MIRKIVIPAGGLGTRLLPITKEIPKEMMPLFLHGKNGEIIVKPLIQIIYEKFWILYWGVWVYLLDWNLKLDMFADGSDCFLKVNHNVFLAWIADLIELIENF